MSCTSGGLEGQAGSLANLSLNSMQLAIISLKEKYQQKQDQVDMLETERDQLILSKENLYNELKKLMTTNEKLREQNLRLSSDLEVKSRECDYLSQKLEECGISVSESSLPIAKHNNSREASIADMESLVSYSEEALESLNTYGSPSVRLPGIASNSEKLQLVPDGASERVLVEQAAKNFTCIRNKIKEDQMKMLKVLRTLQDNKNMSDEKANKLLSVVNTYSTSRPILKEKSEDEKILRRCPMCEAEFPVDTEQDEFELHVVQHFSYDESETLKNFDTLPDAYWTEKKSTNSTSGHSSDPV